MRILVLNYEFPPLGGGAAPVTYNLCRELVRKGHSVDVVTMHYRGLPRFEKKEGINIYRVSCLRSRKEICRIHEMLTYIISALSFCMKLTKKKQYDINHTHFIIPTAIISYFLKKARGLRYIVTSHGSDVPGYNPDRFRIMHVFLRPVWRAIIRNAEYIATPSNVLKRMILKIINADNIKAVNNGIYIKDFKQSKKEKEILLSSRLFKRKGFQYFLRAVEKTRLGYGINIVGDGPYRKELENIAKNNVNKVNFLGWMDNKSKAFRKLYERSSIFVFPSTMESFGMVLAEAMAARMAVITTKNSACSEITGKTALLVNPRKRGEIRDAVLKLINDRGLQERLGAMAYERVKANFTWDIVANRYLSLYQKVLKSEDKI